MFFCKRKIKEAQFGYVKLSEEREYLNSFEFHKTIIYDVNSFMFISFVRCCAGVSILYRTQKHLRSDCLSCIFVIVVAVFVHLFFFFLFLTVAYEFNYSV